MRRSSMLPSELKDIDRDSTSSVWLKPWRRNRAAARAIARSIHGAARTRWLQDIRLQDGHVVRYRPARGRYRSGNHSGSTCCERRLMTTIDIGPNTNGLPGIAALESIVGALLTFGLIAAVAGIAISAIAWAVGSHSSNPHVAGRGKTGVIVSSAAAMLIGAANTLVTFFANAGQAVH